MSKFQIKSYYICVDGNNSLPVVALNKNGDIIGSCLMHFDTVTATIQDFFVSPKYRGKGVGVAMLQECENRACKSEFISLCVHVKMNNIHGIKFWKSNRFLICCENVGYFTMAKELGK